MTEQETTTKKETTTSDDKKTTRSSSRGGSRKPFKRGERRPRPKPDFEQKIISIRRVTRVMAGGRRFSFSVAMVIGDKKGSVGVGLGKAGDTALAIQKAINDAKKNMITLKLDDNNSIPHEVGAKYNSARVTMMPNYGRGLVAGSAVRSVLEHAGVRDVSSKLVSRTKNQINIARATIEALAPFSKPYVKKVAKKEGDESLSAAPKRA